MSLLFRVTYAWKCRGTHHKLAVDALRLLRGPSAERWQNLFLSQIDGYLTGAKDPDTKFRDFRNHVLHISDGCWGGAISAAEHWYQPTVEAFRARRWSQAVYAAGVLSHYVTDPIMPLHTGQSEPENNIHRACEWSVSKSYDRLVDLLMDEQGGYPQVELPAQDQWLRRLITRAATEAHAEYESIVEGYDFDKGVKVPEQGLNQELQTTFARLLGLATSTYGAVLAQAIAESEAKAPLTMLNGLRGLVASIKVPIEWVTKKLDNLSEARQVKAMYRELQQTGRVEQTLPEDDRVIRELHAKEVLGQTPAPPVIATSTSVEQNRAPKRTEPAVPAARSEPAAARPAVAAKSSPVASRPATLPVDAAKPAAPQRRSGVRFYLDLDDPIVDAPSIGPKTAKRLQQVGISCVSMLLEYSAADVVALLEVDTITVEDVLAWQQQARLMCQVPGLRGHDVQMLVACGITDPEQLAGMNGKQLHQQVTRFVATPTARRLMRNPQAPDANEVRNWITWAADSRPLRAA
ncbi:MAG: DUF4332 domain-containing protein [Planctomycetaceae bacterium]